MEEQLEQEAHQVQLSPEEALLDRADSVFVTMSFTKRLKVDAGLRSLQMARASAHYYSWTLEQRRQFLGASSVHALCKTIIMKNSEYKEDYSNDAEYPRFIMVIVQYSKKLISPNIADVVKKHHNAIYKDAPEKQIAKKFFKFRLAVEEDAYALSGYKYNAITPFFMQNNNLKIVLADTIVKGLNPAYFWLGGGRVELKMGVSVEEFLAYFGPRVIVGNIS